MKNQELRSSLIKSGIIVILCVFFIYSFASGDSGGITGTIGSLFSGFLFLLGLFIAVTVSVVLMFGIYFAVLYMYDKQTCVTTYNEFLEKLSSLSLPMCGSCGTKCSTAAAPVLPINDNDLNPIRDTQNRLDSQLTALQGNVASLESMLSKVSVSANAATDNLSTLDEKSKSLEEALESKAGIDTIAEATKKFGSEITAIQGSIKPLSDKLNELETSLSSLNSDDNSDSELQQTVDNAIAAIKDELVSMNSAIESLTSKAAAEPQSIEQQTDDNEEHRILSYFIEKADKNKFISLVSEAVAKEMTYAQVGEFLDDSLSADASEVIADHPSLTKDYIRISRQNK